jgi:hypothetical protein
MKLFTILALIVLVGGLRAEDDVLKDVQRINAELRLLSTQRSDLRSTVLSGFDSYDKYKDAAWKKEKADKELLERHKELELAKVTDLYYSNSITRTERAARELQITKNYQTFEKNRQARASDEALKVLAVAVDKNKLDQIRKVEDTLDQLSRSNDYHYTTLTSRGLTNEATNVLSCEYRTKYLVMPAIEAKKIDILAR